MRRHDDISVGSRPGGGGWILAEVSVAVALVAVLLVPLASGVQVALGRCDRAQSQVQALAAAGEERAGEAWEWGETVVAAEWTAGPVLEVCVGSADREGQSVGVWVDGWLVTESPVGAGGEVDLPANVWSGLAGREAVIRARQAEGEWGPPWRTIVADAYGDIPAGAPPEIAGLRIGSTMRDCVVGHTRTVSTSVLTSSWSVSPAVTGEQGLPYLLPICPAGTSCVDLEGHRQSWTTKQGRVLDVYF